MLRSLEKYFLAPVSLGKYSPGPECSGPTLTHSRSPSAPPDALTQPQCPT